ncbi:hypothetical protein B0H14DRAFT_3496766 [Mycena olivaceomarginata]|nr:hypothetical protein B0H14DRAFT_3496766 [Mycena olivaceomarginata]
MRWQIRNPPRTLVPATHTLVLAPRRPRARSQPPSCSSQATFMLASRRPGTRTLPPSALAARCSLPAPCALAPRRPRARSPPHVRSLPATPVLAPRAMRAHYRPPFAHFPLPLLHTGFNTRPPCPLPAAPVRWLPTGPPFPLASRTMCGSLSLSALGTYRPRTPIFTHM